MAKNEIAGVGVVLTYEEIHTICNALALYGRTMTDKADKWHAAGRPDMVEAYAIWRDETDATLQKIRAL